MAWYHAVRDRFGQQRQKFKAWRASSLYPFVGRVWRRATSPVTTRYRRWRDSAQHPRRRSYQQQSSRGYWKWRAKWHRFRFRMTSRYHAFRRQLREQRQTFSAARGLLRMIMPQVFLAVAVVAILAVVEQKILKSWGVIEWLLPTPPADSASAGSNAPRLNASSYDYILSTLAQIAGVFIGLYFTAVNLVASTIYARVPSDIRSLVVGEKLGNVYVKIVAFLGATTTLLLAGNVMGFPPSLLNLALVTCTGLISIYSFLVLGKRVFHFFDPNQLTWQLFTQLLHCIQAATPDGFRWHDPSFQNHAQRQAEGLLGTYRTIVELTCSKDYRHIEAESLIDIANNTLLLLRYYEREKKRIPTESLWFKRTAEEHNWLVADPTSVDMALKSSTAIAPKLVPDLLWFERQIEGAVFATCRELLARGEVGSAALFTVKAQDTLGHLAEDLAVDEALRLFGGLREIISLQATGDLPDASKWAGDPEKPRLLLALCDAMGIGVINILLGFSRRLATITPESFAASIASVRWERLKTMYSTGLPRGVVTQLEWLQKGLSFEREAEGRFVTAQWYRTQIAHLGFGRTVSGSLTNLTELLEAVFVGEVQALIEKNRPVFAAALIQRGLEACHKFALHYSDIKGHLERLSVHRRVPDIPCPEIAWEDLMKGITTVKERLLVQFGHLVPKLAGLPANSGLPDFFGQACLVLSQECYAAMVTGNEKLFQYLFPLVFSASLKAHDRLREQLKDRSDQSRIVLSTEPIIDLMNLSGYAIIYSELNNQHCWGVVQKCWDDYFEEHSDPQAAMETLSAIHQYRERSLLGGPRLLLRTEWQIQLQQQLAARGLTERAFLHRLTSEEQPSHHSPVIRALSGGSMLFEDGEDVFVAVYFAHHQHVDGFKLTGKAKEYARSLQREQGGGGEASDDEGE